MTDKAIRSAKLTLGGMLEKRRHKSAVERAQGQIAPSKYLPGVPRQVHAKGGVVDDPRVKFLAGNHPEVPPVVYHATKSDFHDFRPMSHFGTMQAAHDRYSTDRNLSEGMSVIPAHISLKNPLDVGLERDWQSNRDTIRQAADAMFKSGRLDQHYLQAAEKLYDLVDDKRWGSDPRAAEQRGAELLREAGHDGIIYTNNIEDPGSRSFVTLGPEQVKSSIGNRGTFDPTHPDMTYADGGAANAEMFQGIHPDLTTEEGKPMDLWHGTPGQEFDQFDDAKLGQRDAGFYGRGHYLTPIKGAAEGYADPDMQGTGTVMGPMHAALKNPFVWDVSDPDKAHRTLRDLQSMGVMKHQDTLEPWDNLQRHHINDFMRAMRGRGHDGVVFKSGSNRAHKGISEIVVFKPSAIKHAEAEVFDPNDARIRRADGGRLNLYSKAARIIAGMKDQPMQAADIVKYALSKGAKKAEMAHVDVPPGKATPSQVAEHIEFMQPQIGVHKRETFYRYNDPERYERQIDYLERQGRHDEAEELTREFEAFEGYGGKDAPLYAKYQLPGGENYREHVLTLDNHPDDQTYMAKMHWGRLANPLAHIRMSDRIIGNKKILHIEEMQSDWNNDARRKGFKTGTEQKDYQTYVDKMRDEAVAGIDPTASQEIRNALRAKYNTMDPYMLALKMGRQAEHASLANRAFMGSKLPPRAPYINPKKDEWAELAMKHVLTEAAKGGYDGIAFTPDEAQSERWGGTKFDGIYNKKLPGIAQRLVQQHDPDTDTDDMTRLNEWAVPMIPLSDKARDSITQNSFPSFRRGGYVTHVRRAR